MFFRRALHPRAARLALLAALALALLPSLSRALTPLDLGPQGAAVCRTDGDRHALHDTLDRCAHCLLAAAPWLPAAAPAAGWHDLRGTAPPPALPTGQPLGPVRAAATARAPPRGT